LQVIDFTATQCPPCQMIKPIFEALSKEHTHLNFIKVDVDEKVQEITQSYSIKTMPTFVFMKGGKEVHRLEGANPAALKSAIVQFGQSPSSGAFSSQGHTLSDKGQTLSGSSSSVPSTHDVSNSLITTWSNLNPQAKVLIALCAAYAFFLMI
ncbi:thioredoxin-like protein, partial [Rhizopogon salebrosus TDB-379]